MTNEPTMTDEPRTDDDRHEDPEFTIEDRGDGENVAESGGPDITISPKIESSTPPHETCDECGLKLRDDNDGDVCLLCQDE